MNEIMKAFLELLHSAHSDAINANEYSFDRENHTENAATALSYANACAAKYSAAKALYWSNLDELEHPEIPELLIQFETYTREIRKDYATNHSRQWVSIEFKRLDDLFSASVCDQSIPE